jgi:ribulose 1,5-bisphosphate carboxylase large subunit-like protein
MERYGPDEAVIDVLSPVSNMDLEADPFYQLQMLSVGGPILEFVFYNRVAFLDFELPDSVMRLFPGPQFGIRRIREIVGLPEGAPIVGTIVKPCCGLTPPEVAERVARAVRGGASVIKDDEKMMNPAYCPLEQKVRTVAGALKKVEDETGRRAIYMPHMPFRADRLKAAALRVLDWGASGVMFNATLAHSLGCLQILAGDPDYDGPLYAHCGGLAALTTGPRRIDAKVIAKLARLCGADFFQIGVFGVTDCHVNSLDASLLKVLASAFRDPWGGLNDTVCVTAGGLGVKNVGLNVREMEHPDLGSAVALLAGSNLLDHPDGPEAGARAMWQAVDAYRERGIVDPDALAKYARTNGQAELSALLE